MGDEIEKHKKIRRTKKQIIEDKLRELQNCHPKIDEPIKKRGRKPKGGKIIKKDIEVVPSQVQKLNVILHLKCSLKDLQVDNDVNIQSFNYCESNFQDIKNLDYKDQVIKLYFLQYNMRFLLLLYVARISEAMDFTEVKSLK